MNPIRRYSKYPDLEIITVLTILTLIFVLVPPLYETFIRNILGLAMVLFLPGYALIAARFIEKDDLNGIKRIALSFGLSIAVVLLLGLSLNFTPFKISLVPFLITLTFFTLIMVFIAYLRREKLPADKQFKVTFNGMYTLLRPKFNTNGKLFDLQIIVYLTTLTLIFVLIPPLNETFIRIILGLAMVLFLPGYALIAALFVEKDDLDGIERIALSFGLSIAVVPLMGLGLNFTHFGIRLVPILITLTVFTTIMAVIAYIRRKNLPADKQFEVPFHEMHISLRSELFTKSRSKVDKILTIVLVLSIIASVSMLVYVIVTPKQGEKFTEFYILGPEGMADNYPTNLSLQKQGNLIVGVINHEYENVDYTMKMIMEDESIKQMQISIEHNESWEQYINFTSPYTGNDLKLNFFLYKNRNFTKPYRSLHLWLNVSA